MQATAAVRAEKFPKGIPEKPAEIHHSQPNVSNWINCWMLGTVEGKLRPAKREEFKNGKAVWIVPLSEIFEILWEKHAARKCPTLYQCNILCFAKLMNIGGADGHHKAKSMKMVLDAYGTAVPANSTCGLEEFAGCCVRK
eukprot:3939397-Rhodomonas_salina.1